LLDFLLDFTGRLGSGGGGGGGRARRSTCYGYYNSDDVGYSTFMVGRLFDLLG
jgi:hypothetical protein